MRTPTTICYLFHKHRTSTATTTPLACALDRVCYSFNYISAHFNNSTRPGECRDTAPRVDSIIPRKTRTDAHVQQDHLLSVLVQLVSSAWMMHVDDQRTRHKHVA